MIILFQLFIPSDSANFSIVLPHTGLEGRRSLISSLISIRRICWQLQLLSIIVFVSNSWISTDFKLAGSLGYIDAGYMLDQFRRISLHWWIFMSEAQKYKYNVFSEFSNRKKTWRINRLSNTSNNARHQKPIDARWCQRWGNNRITKY